MLRDARWITIKITFKLDVFLGIVFLCNPYPGFLTAISLYVFVVWDLIVILSNLSSWHSFSLACCSDLIWYDFRPEATPNTQTILIRWDCGICGIFGIKWDTPYSSISPSAPSGSCFCHSWQLLPVPSLSPLGQSLARQLLDQSRRSYPAHLANPQTSTTPPDM